jgi:hypothetical protein
MLSIDFYMPISELRFIYSIKENWLMRVQSGVKQVKELKVLLLWMLPPGMHIPDCEAQSHDHICWEGSLLNQWCGLSVALTVKWSLRDHWSFCSLIWHQLYLASHSYLNLVPHNLHGIHTTVTHLKENTECLLLTFKKICMICTKTNMNLRTGVYSVFLH